jgi:hypothetical protein
MSKVTLLPRDVEKILEVSELNNIVSEITVECDISSGIGAIITMSWEIEYNGLATKMTVDITNKGNW